MEREFRMGDVVAEIGGSRRHFVVDFRQDVSCYILVPADDPQGDYIHGGRDYVESHYVKVGRFEDWKECSNA